MARTIGVRAKVNRAAVQLFAAKGIDGVSIAEIAAAAEVSQGALYRHYRSKDELASALFSTANLRTGAELDAIRASRPGFASRVAAMVAHFCALYDMDAALFRFMLIAARPAAPDRRRRKIARRRDRGHGGGRDRGAGDRSDRRRGRRRGDFGGGPAAGALSALWPPDGTAADARSITRACGSRRCESARLNAASASVLPVARERLPVLGTRRFWRGLAPRWCALCEPKSTRKCCCRLFRRFGQQGLRSIGFRNDRRLRRC